MPIPPYSGGRWGAQSPSDLTFFCTSSRSAFDSARSASLAWLRRPLHSPRSLGRIFSLTMRAVRIRMSLMWSLSPAIGVTVIGMAFPQIPRAVPRWCEGSLRRFARSVLVCHPPAGQGPLVAAPSHEADGPAGQRREPVLEPGEECDVDDEPQHPADEATNADRADFGYGTEAGDHGQRAEVAVVERLRVGVSPYPPCNRVGSVGA